MSGNGANLQVYPCTGGTNQQFRVRGHFETGRHKILHASTARCMDIANYSHNAGAALNAVGCNGNQNQRFEFEDVGGAYRIRPTHSANKCIDVPAGSSQYGLGMQQWNCHNGSSQRFTFDWRHGDYRVRPASGLCVEQYSGTRVTQWGCDGGGYQNWTLAL